MKFLSIISIMAIGAVIAVGCATTAQTTPQLNQAQQAYSQARNDPMVSQHAPVPLYEAGQALEKAENAKSEAERRHYAYLAQTKVELAQTRAAEEAAENQLAQLRAQQEEMLLTARTQELERAQQEARQAREELRTYRSAQQEQELTQARQQAEQTRAELQELRQEMQNMQAEQTRRGILLTFGDVLFTYDKAELKPGAEHSIRQLADFLKDHPDRRVIIEGHTDNRGPEAYNQQLSQKRAQAVADILMAQGIGSDRITTRGLGENYPIAPNTTVTGRQENRRVEIIIPTPGQSGERPIPPSGT